MFERLVRNDVAYTTLTRQRRMIPEIRRLLAPIYEDTLKDHESVKNLANRPPVEGMGGTNSFFFCHEWPESRDGNMSAYNEHETKMITGFVDYLILNGVDASRITLLTFYNGQRKRLLRECRNHQNSQAFTGIKIVTVDGYQGEENDIVILSLVRSNRKHQIGFLSSDNRACVALSRAKRGFYIFGNAELLARESRVWAHVVEIMYKDSKVHVSHDDRIELMLEADAALRSRVVRRAGSGTIFHSSAPHTVAKSGSKSLRTGNISMEAAIWHVVVSCLASTSALIVAIRSAMIRSIVCYRVTGVLSAVTLVWRSVAMLVGAKFVSIAATARRRC
jgi:hypothetical protein